MPQDSILDSVAESPGIASDDTIINHTCGVVFVHVPRNADTSVSCYFYQLSICRDQEIGATKLGEANANEFGRCFRPRKHSTHSEIELAIGVDELASYMSVAVVRDSFDRVRYMYHLLWSCERWWTLERWQQYANEFERYQDIDAFVASDMFTTNGPGRLFLPQVTWLADKDADTSCVEEPLMLESHQEVVGGLVTALDLLQDWASLTNVRMLT